MKTTCRPVTSGLYFVKMAAWTALVMVSDTITVSLMSYEWLVAYVRETNGAAQLLIITTIIAVNLWRYAMKLLQERVIPVKEQVASARAKGKDEAASAIAAKLRQRGMSESDIDEIVNGTVKDGVISNGGGGKGSDDLGPEFYEAMGRITAAALIDAANRIAAASEKTEDVGEAEKPESRV